MHILQWLRKQGYEYTWNFKIGAKTPDLIAFNDKEIVILEIKKHSNELSKEINQCLSYTQFVNKVYVVLPAKETEKLKPSLLKLLEKNGVGLIQANNAIKILIEPRVFNYYDKEILEKLRDNSLSNIPSNGKNLKDIEEKIKITLANHPEGLSITEIASILKVHRHTVVKYMQHLLNENMLSQRKIGPVKICYLKKSELK